MKHKIFSCILIFTLLITTTVFADPINPGTHGNKTLTASWTPISYTITYNLGGGTNNASNPSSYNIETPTFTLANPTRSGYAFTGWSGDNTTITKGSTGNLTYTANWQKLITTSDVPANLASSDGRLLTNIVNFINNNKNTTQQICFQGDNSGNFYVKTGSFTNGTNPKNIFGTLIYSGVGTTDTDNFQRAQTLANIMNFILYNTKGSPYGTSSPIFNESSGTYKEYNESTISKGFYRAYGYSEYFRCYGRGYAGFYVDDFVSSGSRNAVWW